MVLIAFHPLLVFAFAFTATGHALSRRQDFQLSTGCLPEDLTPENWAANSVDEFIQGSANFGQGAKFPETFLRGLNDRIKFDCSSFDNFNCEVGSFSATNGADGICAAFGNTDPRAGFVAQAWINKYNNLRNLNFAVQPAAESIAFSNYIEDIVAAAKPIDLPIPRKTLFAIVDIVATFIPVLNAGKVAKAADTFIKTVKRFNKFEDKTKKLTDDGTGDVDPDDLPNILREFVNGVPAWLQGVANEQHADIFITNHGDTTLQDMLAAGGSGDTTLSDMLLGGVHLGTPPSQAEYTDAIEANLKAYLLANTWVSLDLVLEITRGQAGASCVNIKGGRDGDFGCIRLGHPQFEIGSTIGLLDPLNDFGGGTTQAGLDLNDVANNAIACFDLGKSFQDVDFNSVLVGDGKTIPDCLFGIRVKKLG